MEERGRDRHCTRCDRIVHDVASMTRAEVETLLEARERGERVCLHLNVRESDGAVLVADGYVERDRLRRAPPSRMMAAAVATAMTACSIQAPPPEAPSSIAIGATPATPIETRPPEPPPIATAPEMPEPAPPPKTKIDHVKVPPTKHPPPKKRHVELDGDAW